MTATPQATRAAEDGFAFSVATAPPTARSRRLALGVIIATLAAYLAVIPNAGLPLPRSDSFIPTVFAILFVADLITAVLLYSQFAATGLRPLLVLASGYLFSGLIAVGCVLTFPGAFAPAGLLGAGPQSAAWLNVLWRFGFAASIALYAFRSGKRANTTTELAPQSAILWSGGIVFLLVFALTYAAIAGHELLPPMLSGYSILPLGRYAFGVVTLTNSLALLLLLVRTRGRSTLNLWVIVVTVALLVESIVRAVFAPERFTLGFYAIRLIALPVSNAVLAVLLWETVQHCANLASSNRKLQRERAESLQSAGGIQTLPE